MAGNPLSEPSMSMQGSWALDLVDIDMSTTMSDTAGEVHAPLANDAEEVVDTVSDSEPEQKPQPQIVRVSERRKKQNDAFKDWYVRPKANHLPAC
jgi:hypothetical protein